MRSRPRFLHLLSAALLSALSVTLFVAMSAAPTMAQGQVPPTARRAAQRPEFAQRLAQSAASRTKGHPRPYLPQDGLYENGPINGTTDAWAINFGYAVGDSLALASSGTVTGFDLGVWEFPGDKTLTVDWSITSAPFGGTTYASGTVQVTDAYLSINQFGYNIDRVTATGLNAGLNAGTYYLNLQNAITAAGNPLYWDENSGAGCHSQGCPSLASENQIGSIPSESFDVIGSSGPPPPPPCFSEQQGGFKVLYDFTGKADGSSPTGVAMDKAGSLYGVTSGGGSYGRGMVYKLAEKAGVWPLLPLYSFSGGDDGKDPSPVIVGPEGGLYGAAKSDMWVWSQVFRLRPSLTACLTALCSWTKDVLHRFEGGGEGYGTVTAFDQQGSLYGVSAIGGTGDCGGSGCGTVFKLTPASGTWTVTVLYDFTGGNDGYAPSELLVGNDGNLYGAASGGTYGDGVVFQLSPSGGGWAEQTLHSFQWGVDGGYPAFLVQDNSGNLYGIAQALSPGLVFELARSGNNWVFSEFGINHHGPDYEQLENLAIDAVGNLYGTGRGGPGCRGSGCDLGPDDTLTGFGYVFTALPGAGGWQYRDLVFFANQTFLPSGHLALDAHGNVYGTTYNCGKYGQGTVWQVSP